MNKNFATLCMVVLMMSTFQTAHAAEPVREGVLFWSFEQQKAGYPHMEDLSPARLIKRAATVTPLPVAEKPLEVLFSFADKTWTVDDYMTRNRTAGLLVLKDGQVVLERYGLGQAPQMRWTSFSVAKSFSSTLVGAAIQDGKIGSLDDPITTYLPGLARSAYEGVTVRQVLNMTSGVRWNEAYDDPNSDVARFTSEPSVNGSDPVVTYMARLPREAAPGTKWVYKTGETNLVGSLVRAATGKNLSDYLSEKIWQPLGMEGDAYWMVDRSGAEIAGCCLSATLRDYGRFALFFMRGARPGQRPIRCAGRLGGHGDHLDPRGHRGPAGPWRLWLAVVDDPRQGLSRLGHLRPGHLDRSRAQSRRGHAERLARRDRRPVGHVPASVDRCHHGAVSEELSRSVRCAAWPAICVSARSSMCRTGRCLSTSRAWSSSSFALCADLCFCGGIYTGPNHLLVALERLPRALDPGAATCCG